MGLLGFVLVDAMLAAEMAVSKVRLRSGPVQILWPSTVHRDVACCSEKQKIFARRAASLEQAHQDSPKGGAVETGCSGSHYITGCFTI